MAWEGNWLPRLDPIDILSTMINVECFRDGHGISIKIPSQSTDRQICDVEVVIQ